MNIFDTIQMYAGKWQVKSERSFTEDEIASVDSVEVVSSEYGKSACFFMKNGQRGYIPLDQDSELVTPIGTILDIKNLTVKTLSRIGDADIQRINIH